MDYDGHGVFGCVSEATKYHSNRQRPTLDEATVLAYLRPISALCTLGSPSPRQSGPTARRGGDEKVDIPPASTKAPGNWSPPRRGHVRSTRCHGPVGPTPGDAHRTRFGSSRGGWEVEPGRSSHPPVRSPSGYGQIGRASGRTPRRVSEENDQVFRRVVRRGRLFGDSFLGTSEGDV